MLTTFLLGSSLAGLQCQMCDICIRAALLASPLPCDFSFCSFAPPSLTAVFPPFMRHYLLWASHTLRWVALVVDGVQAEPVCLVVPSFCMSSRLLLLCVTTLRYECIEG